VIWMSVCFECCVLSGWKLCVEMIARPDDSYRVLCVYLSVILNPRQPGGLEPLGLLRHGKKKKLWSLIFVTQMLFRRSGSEFSTQSLILFSSEYFHYKIFIHEKCLVN